MTRPAIRNHIANAMTAQAIVRNKLQFIHPQGVYGDLDALAMFIDGALTEAERLAHELRRARDTANDVRMAEQDAANRVDDTARALGVIGEALANYRPEPRENVIPHPSSRPRLELVSDSNGAA
jgi:anti-sigma factor RsiW